MVYFANFHKSMSLFKRNFKIIVPGVLALLMSLGFSLVFILINDLAPVILRDPSSLFIAGGLSALAKKISSILITHSQLLKIGLTLAGFFVANFFAGSTLVGMKFSMINDAIRGKKLKLKNSFFKGMTYYWQIVEMRVMVFILIVLLSLILSFPLFIIARYTGGNSLIVLLSVIIILLLIKFLLLFRYPVMFKHNVRAIPALNKSMTFFKKYIRYTFVVWFIIVFFIFAASVLFDFLRSVISDYFYNFAGWAVLLLIFYVIKEFAMVIVNTLVDIFGFISYVKHRK